MSPPTGHWSRWTALRQAPATGLDAALAAWPGGDHPALGPRLAAAVLASSPNPSARELGTWLDPRPLPSPAPGLTPAQVLDHARRHGRPAESGADDPLRWKIAQISWYGALRRHYEARGAMERPRAESDADDSDARACWTALFEGRAWDVHARWESRYLAVAMGVFAALLAARQVPPAVRQRKIGRAHV